MKTLNPIRPLTLTLLLLLAAQAYPQQKPQIEIDLKPLGIAPDLFTDQSDSKYQQRGFLNLFWLTPSQLAVAFSTSKLWDAKPNAQTLTIKLVVFDLNGTAPAKPLHTRDWTFPAEGPTDGSVLEIVPGPDSTILAIHDSISTNAATPIPDGNLIQVLGPDLTLRQNYYVPATSAYLSAWPSDPRLVTQQLFADKHTTLTWFGGRPLKAEAKLDLPPGNSEILVGPGEAARATCIAPTLCTGIHVFTAAAKPWNYTSPSPGPPPIPRAFLAPDALLIELRPQEGSSEKTARLLIAHANGAQTELPPLPKGQQLVSITGIAANGQRLSLEATVLCGSFSFFCKSTSRAYVLDAAGSKILLEQSLNSPSGQSALSPDGKRLAILDRGRLSVYATPDN